MLTKLSPKMPDSNWGPATLLEFKLLHFVCRLNILVSATQLHSTCMILLKNISLVERDIRFVYCSFNYVYYMYLPNILYTVVEFQ